MRAFFQSLYVALRAGVQLVYRSATDDVSIQMSGGAFAGYFEKQVTISTKEIAFPHRIWQETHRLSIPWPWRWAPRSNDDAAIEPPAEALGR
jgi:hypothetical protein